MSEYTGKTIRLNRPAARPERTISLQVLVLIIAGIVGYGAAFIAHLLIWL